MIRTHTTELDPAWGELVDIDVSDDATWVGVFRRKRKFFVRTPDTCFAAPNALDHARVRHVGADRCLLVGTPAENGRRDTLVLTRTGGLVRTFHAGNSIQDVLVSDDTIVVTYFDEGACSNHAPDNEGLAIFDTNGTLRGGYHTRQREPGVDIADCYAACWVDRTRIAFCPYAEFPLVTLDVHTFEQHVVIPPQQLHGARALTTSRGRYFFVGPYQAEHAVLAWTPGESIENVGECAGRVRGLGDGRFIGHDATSFTIIDCA